MVQENDMIDLYRQRENKRRLNSFPAYKALTLGAGVSFIISLLLLLNALDFSGAGISIKLPVFIAVLAYFLPALLAYIISKNVKHEILKHGEVARSTRYFGIALLPFMFIFNVFVAIAGFMLIKKEKSVEYIMGAWAIITSVSVIVISTLNIFKQRVSNMFFIGIAIMSALSVLYVLVTLFGNNTIREIKKDSKLTPIFAILLVLSAASGNLFALVMGMMMLSKIKNKGKYVEWIEIVRRLLRNNTAMLGLFFVVFLISVSIMSYFTFDYKIAITNRMQIMLTSPSLEFPFGTDEFGRCIFTRIIFGARISLLVGFSSTGIPILAGGALGAIAGFYGKRFDNIIMRVLDVFFAVPSFLLAIAIIASFGASTTNLIIALSISGIPMYGRTMRAQVLSINNNEFVEAAKAVGQKRYLIIIKHVIPNSLAPIIVRASLGIGSAVLATASLSFIGLGVEPHIPEWGNVLRSGSKYLELHPYLAMYPGIAIVLIVLAFNYFGDGLRDALDPKLK